ncbi:MAG TPA: hypothetical protein VKQ08_07455, partial [Cyclobacteriaceae bacterium]|nr:hypothetical protein [Cyclobacteriaceae bacterium]
MTKVFWLALISFAMDFSANAQTGFYLIIENIGKCSHEVEDFDGKKKYCIPENAIVNRTDFKVEGHLQYSLDLKEQFFNIRFNKSSFETLKIIHDGMLNSKLVLVVNGKAMGVYDRKT